MFLLQHFYSMDGKRFEYSQHYSQPIGFEELEGSFLESWTVIVLTIRTVQLYDLPSIFKYSNVEFFSQKNIFLNDINNLKRDIV